MHREKEEQNKREQEQLKRKKEDDDRKRREKEEQDRREALERNRILQQQKEAEELDKKAAQQLAISAVSDLLGLDENEEVKGPLSNVKQENISDTESQAVLRTKIYDVNKQGFELAKRNVDINRGIEAYLKEVGTLLVDSDVVYALHNIQELGHAMRAQHAKQPASAKNTALDNQNDNIDPNTGDSLARNLFPPKDMLPLHRLRWKLVKLLQRMMVQVFYAPLQLEVKCLWEENDTHKRVYLTLFHRRRSAQQHLAELEVPHQWEVLTGPNQPPKIGLLKRMRDLKVPILGTLTLTKRN